MGCDLKRLLRIGALCLPLSVAAVEPGVVPEHWRSGGPDCVGMPDWEVQPYNDRLLIVRQSGCTNYEKPFLYLLMGNQSALLLDTGAGNVDPYAEVHRLLQEWATAHSRAVPKLVVAHSHGHGDHIAGDQLFRDKPEVTLIEPTRAAAQNAFHIADWLRGQGSIDLGDRVVDVLAIPGHQEASLAYYDRVTQLLFTGDSLYTGRLYVGDWAAYRDSMLRLVQWTDDKPVAHVLGCHIEQKREAFEDYPVGTKYQPDEHELGLGRAHLLELADALKRLGEQPKRLALQDFTIWPVQPKPKP